MSQKPLPAVCAFSRFVRASLLQTPPPCLHSRPVDFFLPPEPEPPFFFASVGIPSSTFLFFFPPLNVFLPDFFRSLSRLAASSSAVISSAHCRRSTLLRFFTSLFLFPSPSSAPILSLPCPRYLCFLRVFFCFTFSGSLRAQPGPPCSLPSQRRFSPPVFSSRWLGCFAKPRRAQAEFFCLISSRGVTFGRRSSQHLCLTSLPPPHFVFSFSRQNLPLSEP